MSNDTTIDDGNVSSRRAMFVKGGAAAALAAVAATGLGRTADAANGDTMLAGENTSASDPTTMSGGTYFQVTDGSSGGFSSVPASLVGKNSRINGVGVYGHSSGERGMGVSAFTDADESYGLHATSIGAAGTGVYGHDFNSVTPGVGVWAVSHNGYALRANGEISDLSAVGSGRIKLDAAGVSAPPSGVNTRGTVARDAGGTLWYCAAGGDPGDWRKIAGSETAGALHTIAPIRAFDSRIAAIPRSGKFQPSASRVISIKDGRNQKTGIVDAADAIPEGARAIAYNVTATNTAGGSYLAVVPGGVTSSAVSSLNWSGPGTSIANAGIVALDASRQVRIIAGPGGEFDAIVDITGYYI